MKRFFQNEVECAEWFIMENICINLPKLHDLNQTNVTILIGDLDFAIENLGQTASDFTLTITPISSNIVSVGSPVTVSGMSVLQQNNVAVNYELNTVIQPNDEIEFKVVLTNDYPCSH